MAKGRSWGEEGTDPGVPMPSSDATVVGPAPEAPDEETTHGGAEPRARGQVHLGPGNGHSEPAGAEKTRVASLDDIEPPAGEQPAGADATMVVSNPLLSGDEEAPEQGNADATMVTHNPLAQGRPKKSRLLGRLVVIAGKEEGRSIDVSEGKKVLGRSKDCDITLLDIQISRRHVEIEGGHGGVKLSDLASGNGTFVNDESVESVTLVHGDEIAIGDHLLRFEEEGPVASGLPALVKKGPAGVATRPAPGGPPMAAADVVRRARQRRAGGAGKPNRKKLLVAAGGALAIVAFAGMALALRPDAQPEGPTGPTVDEVVQRTFATGVQQFSQQRYDEALESFEQVQAKMPDHRDVGRYLQGTRREIASREAISRGNAMLEQEDYAGAREAFGRVDGESLRHDEAQQLIRRVDEAEARALVIEADALLDEDELDDARQVYRRALAVVSDYSDARDGLQRADEREQEIAQMSRAQRARQARLAKQRRAQARRQAQARVRRALAVGERHFNQGDFQRSLDTFIELSDHQNAAISRQAGQKADAVRAFRPAYERGMSAAESRAAEQAVNDLTVAERHARVVNRNGAIHKQVRERLADMHHLQGRIAFNGKRYQVAFQNWSKSLEMSPQHRYARQGMADLERIGEELYLEAYMVRTLNPSTAAQKFRQVMAMTPPQFEYHRRSRQRLSELER